MSKLDNDKRKEIEKKLEEIKQERERRNGGNNDNNDNKPPKLGLTGIIMAIMAGIIFMSLFNNNLLDSFVGGTVTEEIPYSEFVTKIENGEIKEIKEKDEFIVSEAIKTKESEKIYTSRKITTRLGEDENLMRVADNKGAYVESLEGSRQGLFLQILIQFLPILLIIGMFVYLSKRMSGGSGGPGQIFNFGKTNVNKNEKKIDVRFKDVAGVEEAKEELMEVVEFLKNPEKFTKVGARVPKGVLLLGEPGTGKTLLAKAIAGESGAAFFSISGSEFVEMFVGVGASRVRDLFEKARKNKPAIIFIDEIDAVGRKRGSGRHGGNDEREQTLNQLLVEMDGFSTDEKIIVIAATNRADVLDQALLRAGRFDRRISVDAPDVNGRLEILKVHAKNKSFDEDVNFEAIAKITPGFVGADLANLLNEAAILAARNNRTNIKMEDLDEAVDKIGMGLGKKSKIISPKEKKILAYHEAGHALISELEEYADPVHKVTIIPRGEAGGYMMPLPEEKLLTSKKDLLADIKVSYGGRAAEEVVFDDISTGAYSDIRHATAIAKAIVMRVGMSDNVGPINLEPIDGEFVMDNGISDGTEREVELEIRTLLKELYADTVQMLKDNRETLDRLVEVLLDRETITGDEVRAIIRGETLPEKVNKTTNIVNNSENEQTESTEVKIENIVKEKQLI